MRDKKRRYETFSFFDHTHIKAHLEKMALRGWLLEKITNWCWVYHRIEPQKLTFAVSYYPKASEFDPEPSEGQLSFQEFCAHTGWELAATSAQMQIFYNKKENPTPIETDPELELETLHQAVKKNYLPSHLLLLAVGILNGISFYMQFRQNPVQVLISTSLFSGFLWILVVICSLSEIGGYYLWLHRARKRAEYGTFLDTYNSKIPQKGLLTIVFFVFSCYLTAIFTGGSALSKIVTVLMLFYVIALITLVNMVKQFLKKRKASRGVNRTLTFTFSLIFAFTCVGAITFGSLKLSRSTLLTPELETYEHNGRTFTVYQHEIPLSLDDFLGEEPENDVRTKDGGSSLLASQYFMTQRPRYDSPDSEKFDPLDYTVTRTTIPFLYDWIKNTLINEYQDEVVNETYTFYEHYEEIDPTPWGAKEAYQLYWSDGYFIDRYLLCYEDTFVEITFHWQLTEEEKGIVGQQFTRK